LVGSGRGGAGAIEVKGWLTRGKVMRKGSCEQPCAAREPFFKIGHRVRPVPCSKCGSEACATAKLRARLRTVRLPFDPCDPRAAAVHQRGSAAEKGDVVAAIPVVTFLTSGAAVLVALKGVWGLKHFLPGKPRLWNTSIELALRFSVGFA
jgi:hypothetical protein